jgi:hypothetical protein
MKWICCCLVGSGKAGSIPEGGCFVILALFSFSSPLYSSKQH